MDDEVDVRDVEVDSPVRHPPLTNEDLSQLSLSGKKRSDASNFGT